MKGSVLWPGNTPFYFGVHLVLALCLGFANHGLGESPSAAVPRLAAPPVIDGAVSESEWREAVRVALPEQGGVKTSVRLAWREEGLYVGLIADENTPFSREPDPREGSLHAQDVFEVFIDPVGDARQYYEIQLALSGETFFKNFLLSADPEVTAEGFLTEEFRARHFREEKTARPKAFLSASKYDPSRGVWTAELFLPATFLNSRNHDARLRPGVLRANLVRHDWRNASVGDAAFLYWAPVKSGHPHISPTLMGSLSLEAAP